MASQLGTLSSKHQFGLSLGLAIAVSVGFYCYGIVKGYNLYVEYLIWNVFLAALPLAFALRLVRVLHRKRWSAWEPLGWTLLWLVFLPNSFYMISDFIHLREVPSSTILYAAVMFTSFIYLGVLLGFCSLCLVHYELRRRLTAWAAAAWVGGTLLICSAAIYIGRDLRWNSWDVIINPGGLLFDISDRLLRPEAYPTMFVTIISFFALLSSLYMVVWSVIKIVHGTSRSPLLYTKD